MSKPIRTLSSTALPMVMGPAPTLALEGFQQVQGLISGVLAYKTEKRRLRVEQQRIEADTRVALESLRSMRELMLTGMNQAFVQRQAGLDGMMELAARALEKGDVGSAAAAIHAVVQIATSSPFACLSQASEARAALADPNQDWRL